MLLEEQILSCKRKTYFERASSSREASRKSQKLVSLCKIWQENVKMYPENLQFYEKDSLILDLSLWEGDSRHPLVGIYPWSKLHVKQSPSSNLQLYKNIF